jgi:hypothetical protein
MRYASSQCLSSKVVLRGPNLDKPKANVDKIILLVRTTVTIKVRRLSKVNSVCVDQLINSERSGGEAKQSQNPPHVLNIVIVDTAQDSLVCFI